MGIWIEIHCDVLTEGPHPDNMLRHRCESHENNNPGAMATHTRASVVRILRHLEAEARERGWRKTRGGWACLGCQPDRHRFTLPGDARATRGNSV